MKTFWSEVEQILHSLCVKRGLLKLLYIPAESAETPDKSYMILMNLLFRDRWTDTTAKCRSYCPLQPGLFIKVGSFEWRWSEVTKINKWWQHERRSNAPHSKQTTVNRLHWWLDLGNCHASAEKKQVWFIWFVLFCQLFFHFLFLAFVLPLSPDWSQSVVWGAWEWNESLKINLHH